MTGSVGRVIRHSLAPCLLECSRSRIQVERLYQIARAATRLQEACAPRRAGIYQAKAHNANYCSIAVQRGPTTIAMLNIASHLNHLRASISRFSGTDTDCIDRSRKKICRQVADIPVAWETNDRQLILLLYTPRITKLDASHIVHFDMDNGHVFLIEGTFFFDTINRSMKLEGQA